MSFGKNKHFTLHFTFDAWRKLKLYAQAAAQYTDSSSSMQTSFRPIHGGQIAQGTVGQFKGKAGSSFVEISGFGIVEQDPEDPHTFIVSDVFQAETKGTGATTEMVNSGAEIVQELIEAERFEDTTKLKLWWHVHPGSGQSESWSGQDQKQMMDFGATLPWLASIVVNRNMGFRAAMCFFEPMQFVADGINISYEVDPRLAELEDQLAALETEIKESEKEDLAAAITETQQKVTKRTYASVGTMKAGGRQGALAVVKKEPKEKKINPLKDQTHPVNTGEISMADYRALMTGDDKHPLWNEEALWSLVDWEEKKVSGIHGQEIEVMEDMSDEDLDTYIQELEGKRQNSATFFDLSGQCEDDDDSILVGA